VALLHPDRKVHFVGIGGAGMSGLAKLLVEQGYRVSGTDVKESPVTQRLAASGCRIGIGHGVQHVQDADLVVYSSAIVSDNPELVEARRRRIEVVQRAVVLAALMAKRRGIAVTGAHGKTTTTSLISMVLRAARLDPTVVIGGEVNDFGGNAFLGRGEYLVAEADESDGSFLELSPQIAVLTNLDAEHLDHYGSVERIEAAYRQFVRQVRPEGLVVYCSDDWRLVRICGEAVGLRSVSFGLSSGAHVRADGVELDGFGSRFQVWAGNRALGEFRLRIPGVHNVSNATAAIAVALEVGVEPDDIRAGLEQFSGAERRFQVRGCVDQVLVVDDYAHHPTEIEATLQAARRVVPSGGRLLALFQPHRYTRTMHLADRFGSCFAQADHLVLTDVYAASERPIEGVSSRLIYDAVRRAGRPVTADYRPFTEVVEAAIGWIRPGDVVMVMGAGDITELGPMLVERLRVRTMAPESAPITVSVSMEVA